MREQVYPGLIQRGKLNRDRANIQYLSMKEALNILELLRNGPNKANTQQKLFQDES